MYDLDNGRVLKKRYSGFSQYRKIFLEITRGKPAFIKAYTEQKRVQLAERESRKYVQSILHHIDSSFLGSPDFKNGGDYEQDKVSPLREILKKGNDNENKKLLGVYATLTKKLWGYGFADTVFNFTVNNGVYDNGKMIQLDFGEITTDKEKVKEMIVKKRWLQSSSYKRLHSEELKQYYAELMESELTETELEKLWGTKTKKSQTFDLFTEIRKLNFPPEDYVVIGGAALAGRGLKETRDIDLLVSRELLAKLASGPSWKPHPRIIPSEEAGLVRDDKLVELYPTVGLIDLPFETIKASEEIIDGVPFANLTHILAIKEAYARKKDLVDIQRIKNYLTRSVLY